MTRNGLVILSNSDLMRWGASYGAGIYCSNQFSVANGYACDSPLYNNPQQLQKHFKY